MKNIIKSLLIITAIGFLTTSCGNEPFDIKDGGKALASVSPNRSLSYFFGISTDITVNMDAFENSGVTISSVSATKVLRIAKVIPASDGSDSVIYVVSGPATFDIPGDSFTQTTAELFADVPVEGNVLTPDDLSPGDTWTFSYSMTLSDGTVLDSPAKTVLTFTCLSDLAGDYTGVSGGTSTDGCPPTNPLSGLVYDVSLEETSAGVYDISDFSVGVYQDWYGACYGYSFETTAPIVDVCGVLTMAVTEAFGCDVVGTGTVNADGTITMSWSNCFGDTGFYTLTKK